MRALLLAVAIAVTASGAHAQDATAPKPDSKAAAVVVQREVIADCNWQATERRLAGPKRQQFMSECLGSSTGSSSPAKEPRAKGAGSAERR